MTEKAVPVQTADVIAVIAGLGLTVTVTIKDVPVQLPRTAEVTGVTVYVAVCAELDVFVSVPVMSDAPLPDAPPVIPPVTAGVLQL